MSGERVDDDDDGDDEVCACWYCDTAKESKRAGSSTRYWCVRGGGEGWYCLSDYLWRILSP